MLRPIDHYFLEQEEPFKSCLLAMRAHLLHFDPRLTEAWKYRVPFYCVEDKMFCYLWVHKKFKQPYLGLVDGKLLNHPELLAEKRSRMKILLLDPNKNLPFRKIDRILKDAMALRT